MKFRNKKTGEIVEPVGIMLLITVIIVIIVVNQRETVLEPQIVEVVEPCEMDGVENCEAVRVYDGETLVKFYVRGTRKE